MKISIILCSVLLFPAPKENKPDELPYGSVVTYDTGYKQGKEWVSIPVKAYVLAKWLGKDNKWYYVCQWHDRIYREWETFHEKRIIEVHRVGKGKLPIIDDWELEHSLFLDSIVP